MIVIAHNYVHVLEMCDRVNLLRNGRIVLDKRTDETTVEELTGSSPRSTGSARQRRFVARWRIDASPGSAKPGSGSTSEPAPSSSIRG